jgi:2-methylisocitrate lyase-like PEP mutase family enzyme
MTAASGKNMDVGASGPSSPGAALRQLLKEPGLVKAPAVYNGLVAILARSLGFQALTLSGYAIGANTGTTEPLMSLTECVARAKEVTDASPDCLLIADAGAGFGEPLHVKRTVQQFEQAGVAAIHLEDQAYPKRASYHRGIEEVVSAEEMCQKLDAAMSARRNDDFVIIARTDAMRTHDYEEGVRRARLYVEAGADAIMVFPNSDAEMAQAPKDIAAPLVYTISHGNPFARPVPSAAELERMGYKVAYDAMLTTFAQYAAVRSALIRFRDNEPLPDDYRDLPKLRAELEAAIGIDDNLAVETATVLQ